MPKQPVSTVSTVSTEDEISALNAEIAILTFFLCQLIIKSPDLVRRDLRKDVGVFRVAAKSTDSDDVALDSVNDILDRIAAACDGRNDHQAPQP